MVLDYSSTSFGDIPIKHSSELDGSPCILKSLSRTQGWWPCCILKSLSRTQERLDGASGYDSIRGSTHKNVAREDEIHISW